jgi:hypothetical protein
MTQEKERRDRDGDGDAKDRRVRIQPRHKEQNTTGHNQTEEDEISE